MPSVSHSEADQYNECKRKHHYGYTRSLEPVHRPLGMDFGSMGHRVLESYYKSILGLGGKNKSKQRRAHAESVEAAREQYRVITVDEGWEQPDTKNDLGSMLFDTYFPNEPFIKRGWKILAAEQKYMLEYDDENHLGYPFVVDVWAEDPQGKSVIVDHKFLSDFYTPFDIKHLPQIPKYIGALRGLNHRVDYGLYNMFRTKALKLPTINQLMRQEIDAPNGTRVARTFADQIGMAQEIQALKDLTPEEQDALAWRTSNKNMCRSCYFAGICDAELVGAPTKLLIRQEYKTRTRSGFEVTPDA